jgi:chromosomal replication initiator protein
MYNVWENALAEIEQKISSGNFSTWFQDTSLLSTDDGHVVIGVKNTFFIKQLRSKFLSVIETALKNAGVEVKDIDFQIEAKSKSRVRPHEVVATSELLKDTATKIKLPKVPKDNKFSTGLSSKYTLDSFIVGSHNDVAAAAAKSIIEAPGTRYNPFFLYGSSGLGKTHLVQAIGNEIVKKHPDLKVLYLPISDFYAEFVNHVMKGKGKEFNTKFRSLDVLIIDDFQLIVNKEKSQEEFFNIFNSLHQANKQIIVVSDRLPSQIKTVDERMANRLTWAGAFDLQLPAFEDKCAILRSKANLLGAEIENEAIEYIAENVTTNIRDLESELSTILLMSEVRNLTPLELINNGVIKVSHEAKLRPTTPKRIIEKVAKYYNITPAELKSRSRVANIKNARQIAMYLLQEELHLSTTQVAAEVGLTDHSTVCHGVKKIKKDLKLNFTLRDQIAEIKGKIYD